MGALGIRMLHSFFHKIGAAHSRERRGTGDVTRRVYEVVCYAS